jgi:hypothetical protein
VGDVVGAVTADVAGTLVGAVVAGAAQALNKTVIRARVDKNREAVGCFMGPSSSSSSSRWLR